MFYDLGIRYTLKVWGKWSAQGWIIITTGVMMTSEMNLNVVEMPLLIGVAMGRPNTYLSTIGRATALHIQHFIGVMNTSDLVATESPECAMFSVSIFTSMQYIPCHHNTQVCYSAVCNTSPLITIHKYVIHQYAIHLLSSQYTRYKKYIEVR